ncbi:hypothetical protein C8Q75DRAFT_766346 [Abortiporus biennis]|nr:hypothetical protein C8Q75DRAFT_766346 [Abortiporus biennis]
MRRSQTLRTYGGKANMTISGVDDLGVLKESDETLEDCLRRQLLESNRENDKLKSQLQSLQTQLAQRPPLDEVNALRKDLMNLDILLQGTQRENERCMADLVRTKDREKQLEKELERLAGANWQANLDIAPANTSVIQSRTAASLMSPAMRNSPPTIHSHSADEARTNTVSNEETLAQIEQIRLLVLGMEQRLQTREQKLTKAIERAEAESSKFETMRKQATPSLPS